jgi:hypothetical protein
VVSIAQPVKADHDIDDRFCWKPWDGGAPDVFDSHRPLPDCASDCCTLLRKAMRPLRVVIADLHLWRHFSSFAFCPLGVPKTALPFIPTYKVEHSGSFRKEIP